jgi:ribosomal-protein-alanine N-acetyltransferase
VVQRRRVQLFAPEPSDQADFVAAMRASRALHRPWLYPPTDAEAYRAYLGRLRSESKVGYLARRVEDGALVAWLNVSEIVRGSFQSAYLGYGSVAAFAGRGYMTEALGLVLRDAFGPLGLHRLEANIQPANRSSIALVRRCGFEREGFSPRYLQVGGRWRDHERWALRRETWRP